MIVDKILLARYLDCAGICNGRIGFHLCCCSRVSLFKGVVVQGCSCSRV